MTAGHVFARSDSRTCRAITIYNNNNTTMSATTATAATTTYAAVSTSF